MACNRCQSEVIADACFCHRCGFLLRPYCFVCRHELSDDATFCFKCGQNISAYWPPVGQQNLVENLLSGQTCPIPVRKNPLKSQVVNTGKVGERKLVSVLFADLKGFTSMSEKLDPERVTDIVNQCFQRLGAVVNRREGYIDKFMGDCLMALFGAPIAHENDPELAVSCALEIIEELESFNRDLNLDLGISIGINSGLVIAGEVGSDQKLEYTVMGDAVNIAQRLQSHAGRNEIWVSKSIFSACGDKFEFGSELALKAKGKEQTVSAFQVVKTRHEARWVTTLKPLIGRRAELEVVERLLGDLSVRKGSLLLIAGEAGIGKSRFKAEIQTRALSHGLRWFETKCLSSMRETPYAAFLGLIRQILEIDVRASVREQQERVLDLSAYGLDPTAEVFLRDFLGLRIETDEPIRLESAQRRLMLMNTMRSFLLSIATKTPTIFFFEDLHWLDPLSNDALQQLLQNAGGLPLMIAGGARPDFKCTWDEWPNFTLLRLRPFRIDQSLELVQQMLSLEAIPDVLKKVIETRSDGNPLYVEEIVKNLIDKGGLQKHAGLWEVVGHLENLEMPTTLMGLIASRIDRLSQTEKQLIQMASVMGRRFDFKILLKVLPDFSNVDGILNSLRKRGLLDIHVNEAGETEYLFHHALTQEVAYQSILHKHRKLYHGAVAEALESEAEVLGESKLIESSLDLAHHYLEAENDDKAVRFLMMSGKHLAISFHHDGAIQQYLRAISIFEKNAKSETAHASLIDLYNQLALVYSMVGKYDLAESYEHKVIAIATAENDWSTLSRTHRYLGDFYQKRGFFERSMETLKQAMEYAIKSGDSESQVRTMKSLGNSLKDLHQLDRAKEVLVEGLEKARAMNNARLIAEFSNDLSTVFLETQELEMASRYLKESISHTEHDPALKSLFSSSTINLGCVCQYQGDLKSALSRYLTGAQVAGQIGDLKNLIISKNNAAEVLLEMKEFEQARAELEVTEKLAKDCGMHLGRVTASIMLGYLKMKTGRGAEGEKILLEMLHEAADRKFWGFYCDALVYLARYYAEGSRETESRQCLERGLQKADELKNQLLKTRLQDEMSKLFGHGQTAEQKA